LGPARSESGIRRSIDPRYSTEAISRPVRKKISAPAPEKPVVPSTTEQLRTALDAKQAAAPQHPAPGRTSAGGMWATESKRPSVRMDPREVGRVAKATKVAQAKRDK
jgi:hypothetical protein